MDYKSLSFAGIEPATRGAHLTRFFDVKTLTSKEILTSSSFTRHWF